MKKHKIKICSQYNGDIFYVRVDDTLIGYHYYDDGELTKNNAEKYQPIVRNLDDMFWCRMPSIRKNNDVLTIYPNDKEIEEMTYKFLKKYKRYEITFKTLMFDDSWGSMTIDLRKKKQKEEKNNE